MRVKADDDELRRLEAALDGSPNPDPLALRREYRLLAARNWRSIRRFSSLTGILLTVLVVAQLVLGGLSLKLTHENSELLGEIQSTRKQLIAESCETQNARNTGTIMELHVLIGRLPVGQRAAAKGTGAFTVALIDALVPVHDCGEILRKAGF